MTIIFHDTILLPHKRYLKWLLYKKCQIYKSALFKRSTKFEPLVFLSSNSLSLVNVHVEFFDGFCQFVDFALLSRIFRDLYIFQESYHAKFSYFHDLSQCIKCSLKHLIKELGNGRLDIDRKLEMVNFYRLDSRDKGFRPYILYVIHMGYSNIVSIWVTGRVDFVLPYLRLSSDASIHN